MALMIGPLAIAGLLAVWGPPPPPEDGGLAPLGPPTVGFPITMLFCMSPPSPLLVATLTALLLLLLLASVDARVDAATDTAIGDDDDDIMSLAPPPPPDTLLGGDWRLPTIES